MRLFVALDIEDGIREKIARFMEGVRGFAPGARWVRSESLHVTLKFIGEKPAETLESIRRALASVHGSSMEVTFREYGFFPTAKAARVFWVGVRSGPELENLAREVDRALVSCGVAGEERGFSPHLTLARGGGRSGAPGWREGNGSSRNFRVLLEKLAAFETPDFGTMTAREFFLYESKLARGGSVYTKVARFALG